MNASVPAAILLFLAVIGMTGCAGSEPFVQAADVSATKAPALPPRIVNAIRYHVPTPEAPVTRSKTAQWIDALRTDAAAKRAAGEAVIEAYERIRKPM